MSSNEIEVYRSMLPVTENADLGWYGLQIAEGTPQEELDRIGKGVSGIDAMTDWAWGDWGVYYETHWKSDFKKVFSELHGNTQKKVERAMLTCRAFPEPELRARYADLNGGDYFPYYYEVARAGITGSDRDDWLELVKQRPMTPRQFRQTLTTGIAPVPKHADQAPDKPNRPDSQPGWVYPLGPHRLLCGDATEPSHLEALLQGEKASMVWTDPPYGVDYIGKTKAALQISNDLSTDTFQLLVDAFTATTPVCVDACPFYIAGPSGNMGVQFRAALEEVGWSFEQTLIWVKDQFVLGRMDYHWRHEDIIYGQMPCHVPNHEDVLYGHFNGPGGKRGMLNPQRWYGGNNEQTVFTIPRPRRSSVHPTMKPVQLIEKHIRNSSKQGEIVLDMFGGSGSTLIAAELTGRRAYLVELDPGYCDVIRNRYEAYIAEEGEVEASVVG